VRASATHGVHARRTNRFDRDLAAAPREMQHAFEKQLRLLLQHRRHPSLQAKKFDEVSGLWQGRVTLDGNMYVLHPLIPHPK
jgi:hypothetical protein